MVHYVEGKSTADIKDIIVDGDNVVITGTFTHVIAQNGRSFATAIALHLKVQGGKINHLQLYEDTLLISQHLVQPKEPRRSSQATCPEAFGSLKIPG